MVRLSAPCWPLMMGNRSEFGIGGRPPQQALNTRRSVAGDMTVACAASPHLAQPFDPTAHAEKRTSQEVTVASPPGGSSAEGARRRPETAGQIACNVSGKFVFKQARDPPSRWSDVPSGWKEPTMSQ